MIEIEPRGRKKPLLLKHEKDIRSLRDSGYSLKQIVEWLKDRDVLVSATALNNFLKNK